MPRFKPADLREFSIRMLTSAGARQAEAELVADHSIAAILQGEVHHGVELGSQYVPAIRKGLLVPGRDPVFERETDTTVVVDGLMNFGHFVSHVTMQHLIEKANAANVAAASIRYQCHVGRLIDYTAMAAEAGMIALMMCDGAYGPKFVAPVGGIERRIGLNPWSMALPSDEDGTVGFDMTSGAVSLTKIRRARELDESIPEGWVLDRHGRPSTDPNDYFDGGSILPSGGLHGAHKGYVLGFMIEVLADVLSGMDYREDTSREWPVIDGCFMAVFKVDAFRPLTEFTADLSGFVEHVKTSRPADGSEGVFYPGERSALRDRRNRAVGAEIAPDIWERVLVCSRELGVESDAPNPL